MTVSRPVAGDNARPPRIIGYDSLVLPLVLLVDHGHVRSHRLGEGDHHQAVGGLPCCRVLSSHCRWQSARPTRFPKTSSGPGSFGFEGKNRSSAVPSIIMVAAKAHAIAENIMKLVRFDGGKTGLMVQLAAGPHVIDVIGESRCALAGRSHFARHSQRHPERQRKLGSVDRALGAGANWIATTGRRWR